MSEGRIDVLFVCTHNAGRSVVAKVLFNDRATKLGLTIRAESAGMMPGERINPDIQRVLSTFTLDASGEVPKLLTDELLYGEPRIIAMGCELDGESCPVVNFSDVEDWGLPAPANMSSDEEMVPLIHDIARRVNTLIQEMSSGR